MNQSTCAFLGDLLSRYDWVSTSSHSPELIALVSTNAAPTAFQATQLKASIEDLDDPITEIQSEIDLLRNAAATLEMKIARLKDIRHDYRAALSPIRRLPIEILTEILRWTPKENIALNAKDDYRSYHVFGFNVFKISEGPWYLGQVCSSWRDAVQFLCPEIWSKLKISCPLKRSEKEGPMIPAPKKDMVALLNRALERSRNHRLDVFFICWGFGMDDPGDQIEEPEEMIQCFDLLLTHSKRWGAVELSIVPSFLSRLSLVRGRVDRLEDVYLTCIPNAMPGTMNAFEIAPKLQTFELIGMHAEADIPFPEENLLFFSDARPLPDHDTVPKYLDIIASAPDLFDFSYHHYSSTIPELPGLYHPQIVHQSLQTLSTSLGPLIDSLVVPGLLEMTSASHPRVGMPIMCPRDTLSHIYSLVVRSHCSLTILTFVDTIMDDNLLPILRLSPQLISLSFECNQPSSESDTTMKSLFLDMSETVRVEDAFHHTLLPRLECLEFKLHNVEFDAVNYLHVEFVEMIVSRRVPLGSQMLEILGIEVKGRDFCLPFTGNGGLEKLQRLRDDGLELHLDLHDWEERVLRASMCLSDSEDD
ncbi:uncharacterized protein ARMOST_20502 [Armillaria ostoyae]|uniref:F-box domain-containing protein n=1 Tax=Armillaria ostoyae TaxID=47428 RepID=A0A284S7I0_ARMOS|nr:uncharacterized protein ARMOST_20502 [Armillaria ostoyae]